MCLLCGRGCVSAEGSKAAQIHFLSNEGNGRSVSSRDVVTGGRAIAVSVSVEAHSYRTCLSSRHLGDARDAPEDRAGRPASLLSQRL